MKNLKSFLLITLLTQNYFLVCQNLTSDSKENDLGRGINYHHFNNLTSDVVLFNIQDEKSSCFLLSNDMIPKDSLVVKSLHSGFKGFLGTQIGNDGSYQLFLKKKSWFLSQQGLPSPNRYGFLKFDFKSGNTISKEIDFKLVKETFLSSFKIDEKLFLMTIDKNSSVLNFYQFDDNGEFKKNIVDCEEITFRDWDGSKINLYDLMVTKMPLSQNLAIPLSVMDSKIPYSINNTSKLNKLYYFDDKLLLTLDINKDYTQILSINTNTWGKNYDGFIKPNIQSKASGFTKKSNSFLFDGKFFAVTLYANKLKLEIKDIYTKELIKEYTIENEKAIEIKNSPIIILDGPYQSYREVEETAKFFRKIKNGFIGLSVEKNQNESYELSIGAKIPLANVKVVYTDFDNPIPMTANPVNIAYQGVVGGRMTYIKCLLDKNLNNSEGKIEKNVFERIKEFEEREKITNKTMISMTNKIVVGFTKKGVFSFKTFEK